MENPEKILIIDDELDFIEAFQRTMEAKGFQVMVASSMSMAERFLGMTPDTIVLGTLSPAGQAFNAHQWLKQHPQYKNIPLLVIDAKVEERNLRGWRRLEGMQLEAEDYVSKPIEPAALLPRVQRLLERKLGKIRVLVADDHTMVRIGICAVLALQKDLEVVAEAVDGKDALEKVVRLAPNVALMDIVMPVMSGIEATKEISKECPQTKVLILTQYDEEENMVVARNAGAYGFVPKRVASSDLLEGIRAVNAGNYFPKSFAGISSN
jgi:DNA-binding NarL/FixJ family response regulator